MTAEQFEREKDYQSVAAIARLLLSKGTITAADFSAIDTMLKAKYRPIFGALLSN